MLAVPQFPDLERVLILSLSPTPAAIMLHQICYWFRKPKMQDRWWLYKTFDEWRDERGLSRRQVNKGREDLIKKGLIEEMYGPYKRVHTCPDWVKLAATLNLNPTARPQSVTNRTDKPQTPETGRAISVCTDRTDHEPHSHADNPPKEAVQSRLHGQNPENFPYLSDEPPKEVVQTNTEDYAGEYEQEIPLTEGADASSSRLAPQQGGDCLATKDSSPTPTPGPPKLDPSKDRKYRDVLDLVLEPEREVREIALRVLHGEEDREKLVRVVGKALGDPLGGEQYRACITQAVAELAGMAS